MAVVGFAVVSAPGSTENAKANGDTRTIYLHHAHTQESISATYMVDGQYDSGVLQKLNWFLRDWRREEPTHMDPRLFDVIWTVYRESGSAQPIQVMSAYRSPETNAMLRRRSRQVAEHSQHILGKAMDQHYMDVPMSRIREIAMKLQRGGVGFYPTAGTPFVHMDVGGVRHWPRMSYDQLARLFPDGKTVHIPANGQPLARYEEARAELESRGDSFAYPTASEVKSKGFFAWLFGGDDEEDSSGGRGGSPRDTAPSRQRVASLDRAPTGTLSAAPSYYGLQSRDAGVRAFNSDTAPPPSPPVAAPRRAVQAPPPAPPAEAVDLQAQQRLAEAMEAQQRAAQDRIVQERVAQERARQEAVAPVPPPAPPPVIAPSPQVALATQALSGQALSGNDATLAPTAPIPPRRPVELASEGPVAPLPPSRPAGMVSLAAVKPGVSDPIRGLIGASGGPLTPSRTPGLPAAITLGAMAPKSPAPPVVMAYAAPVAPPVPPTPPVVPPKAAVPLPVARPSFVAARLDRSNFRSLTASAATSTMPPRSGFGSAMVALRPAAQNNLGTLAAQPSSGAAQGFSKEASGLTFDRFSGPVVKPRNRAAGGGAAARTADN